MTNDQIESAATEHASKYSEHLKTDIVLHYGLGIVRGLKEGSNDYEMNRLYDWIMDEKRRQAITAFTSSPLRNVAREIEFRLWSKDKEIADLKDTVDRMAARLQEMAQDAIKAQGHN